MFLLWLSCGTNHSLFCIVIIYGLVSDVLSHKFLRAGSISDSPPCYLIHSRFSMNAEWNNEQITNTHLWPTVPFHLSFSFSYACPLLYSYGILSRIHVNFFEEKGQKVFRKYEGNLGAFEKKGRWTACVCVRFFLVGHFCGTFLPRSPSGLGTPLHFFMTATDHTVHALQCPLTAFSFIECFKLHFFKRNTFGEPPILAVWEGN